MNNINPPPPLLPHRNMRPVSAYWSADDLTVGKLYRVVYVSDGLGMAAPSASSIRLSLCDSPEYGSMLPPISGPKDLFSNDPFVLLEAVDLRHVDLVHVTGRSEPIKSSTMYYTSLRILTKDAQMGWLVVVDSSKAYWKIYRGETEEEEHRRRSIDGDDAGRFCYYPSP